MVHQHFMLAPSMTVAENIAVGNPPKGKRIWRNADLASELQSLQDLFELSVPLESKVQDLSVGQMQRVEIMKSLYRGAKIIVLDEGKIVGKGTHKELLKTCEVYQQIAMSQLSKEELGNE